jgi:hypothetical protein
LDEIAAALPHSGRDQKATHHSLAGMNRPVLCLVRLRGEALMTKLFASVAATALFAGIAFAGEVPVEAETAEAEVTIAETVEIEAEGDGEAEIVVVYSEDEEAGDEDEESDDEGDDE